MTLAAVSSLPPAAEDGAPLPGKALVLVLITAAGAATLTVQGQGLADIVKTSGLAVAPEHAAARRARTGARWTGQRSNTSMARATVDGVNPGEDARLRGRHAERLNPGTDAG